ncbi:hypothetical protein CAFE_20580 [Caprobacter fermentans]|uniref:Uncharacterized protein n=1 Tax=Caproicibacter fermentans TaxID=2576756 RepID=A0A6N8I0I1_9FIRM|nr:hypothetical protein [Caproicibacter fermentans]MVB11345.1 hypothetical protein [Caproicibacter fermentans]
MAKTLSQVCNELRIQTIGSVMQKLPTDQPDEAYVKWTHTLNSISKLKNSPYLALIAKNQKAINELQARKENYCRISPEDQKYFL